VILKRLNTETFTKSRIKANAIALAGTPIDTKSDSGVQLRRLTH